MTDLQALLAAILNDPADDVVRLVYADRLDDGGDEADAARAEFIRLQVAGVRPDRQEELLADWAMDWLPAVVQGRAEEFLECVGGTRWQVGDAGDVGRCEVAFARGFVSAVALPGLPEVSLDESTGGVVADGFADALAAFFDEHPVERVAVGLHAPEEYRIENQARGGPDRWVCCGPNAWVPPLCSADDRDAFAERLRDAMIERVEAQARMAYRLWQRRGDEDE